MFKLNGERQRFKGKNGIPATILLNGQKTSIQEHIKEGDSITVTLAQHGDMPHLTVAHLVKTEKCVILEGQAYELPLVFVNDKYVQRDYIILSNDEIRTVSVETLKDLLQSLNLSTDNKLITKDFERLNLDYQLKHNDSLLIDIISPSKISESKFSDFEIAEEEILEELVGSETQLEEVAEINHLEPEDSIKKTDSTNTSTDKAEMNTNLYIMVNGQLVCLPYKDTSYILASIFDFIEFDLSKPQGTIQLIKNGESGALTDVIHNGDVLEIYWKK